MQKTFIWYDLEELLGAIFVVWVFMYTSKGSA